METFPGSLTRSLARVVGPEHVLTGDAAAGYAVDWTGRFRGQAAAAVRPTGSNGSTRSTSPSKSTTFSAPSARFPKAATSPQDLFADFGKYGH